MQYNEIDWKLNMKISENLCTKFLLHFLGINEFQLRISFSDPYYKKSCTTIPKSTYGHHHEKSYTK